MRYAIATATVIAVGGLTGCAKEPPKCSDPETVGLVRQIIVDKLGAEHPAAKLGKKDIEDKLLLENPRASGYDEKIRKYSCEGTLVAPVKVDNLRYQVNVEYESQLDDKAQHLVVLKNLQLGDLIGIGQALSSNIEASRSASGGGKAATPVQAVGTQQANASQQAVSGMPALAPLVGKDPQDALDHPALRERFKALLGDKLAAFRERLNVSSGIAQEGEWLVGSGGMPHLFAIEEAAFAVNAATGEVFAIMLTDGKNLTWFGADDVSKLPAPLQSWHREHGGA